jgi:membrane peptidoglycan carboxypeptidase
VRDTMTRLGLHQSNGQEIGRYAPQYILGASDVSPQGVAHAYGVLAADGKKCPMVVVTKITKDGKNVALPKSTCDQAVEPDVARATDKFLEYNMTNGSGIRNQLAGGDRQSAGKTGTANNNNESWFVGYTPQLVTAVWVGTPYDPITRVMKNVRVGGQFYPVMHGAAIAAPIWKQIMNGALEDAPIVTFKEPAAKYLQADPADPQTVTPGQLPAVVGKPVPEAEALLRAAGFQTQLGGTMSSQIEAGLVAGISPYQSPPPGSMITIYTSRGNGGVSRQAPTPQRTSTPTVQPTTYTPPVPPSTPGRPKGNKPTKPPKPR